MLDNFQGLFESPWFNYQYFAGRLGGGVIHYLAAGGGLNHSPWLDQIVLGCVERQLSVGGIHIVGRLEQIFKVLPIVIVGRPEPKTLELLNYTHYLLLTRTLPSSLPLLTNPLIT